ncbi:hypothetical protein KC316_g13 [Hortaea werneckii]|nr:hypothetical protein KC316_g13 [Hortaea werneckii]
MLIRIPHLNVLIERSLLFCSIAYELFLCRLLRYNGGWRLYFEARVGLWLGLLVALAVCFLPVVAFRGCSGQLERGFSFSVPAATGAAAVVPCEDGGAVFSSNASFESVMLAPAQPPVKPPFLFGFAAAAPSVCPAGADCEPFSFTAAGARARLLPELGSLRRPVKLRFDPLPTLSRRSFVVSPPVATAPDCCSAGALELFPVPSTCCSPVHVMMFAAGERAVGMMSGKLGIFHHRVPTAADLTAALTDWGKRGDRLTLRRPTGGVATA